MAIFNADITTPANTPASKPIETEIPITKGVIHKLEIDFPAGSRGLLHLQIKKGDRLLWPANTSGSFRTDNRLISFAEHREITFPPYKLIAVTWNLDDTHDHIVIIRFGILPRRIVMKRLL